MATGNRKSSTGKKRQSKKARMAEIEKAQAFRVEVTLWLVVAVAMLLFISNLGFGGVVGKTVSDFLFGIFGLIAYVLPVLLLVGSFFAVSNHGNTLAAIKLTASILFLVFLCTFMGLTTNGSDVLRPLVSYTYCAEKHSGGGLIGGSVAYYMSHAFGMVGSYIITVVALIICLVLITEKSAFRGMQKGGQKVYESAKESNEKYREYREYKAQERKERRMDHKVSGVSIDTRIEENDKKKKKKKSDEMGELSAPFMEIEPDQTVSPISDTASDRYEPFSFEIMDENPHSEPFPPEPAQAAPVPESVIAPLITPEPPRAMPEPEPEITREPEVEPVEEPEPEPIPESAIPVAPMMAPVITPEPAAPPQPKPMPVQAAVSAPVPPKESRPADAMQGYQFPPIDLLKKVENKASSDAEHHLLETKHKLEETLKNFGVKATVPNYSCGPAVTRYEIQPEMGVKVSKIVGLADDIKLNLAAADIRIEAPIPGKAAIGIEIPNKETIMVSFRELIDSPEFAASKSKISFAVGKDIAGKTKVTDIAKMPHLLIAGATGSGKSVCINTIIMSILYKARPDEVKLIMIDPKVVELSVYNGIPHLLIPVVTDPKKASGALNWAVAEMTSRYEKFAEANVREINGYNAKVDSIDVPEGQERPQKMPQIVIIVDELADLMMVASGDVEEAICRLAQLARAAGIHLIIATQRPSVNVITGLIKANMPSRIAFAVTSGTDSRTILDMNGAEKLLGKGDMLFHPQGVPKPIRVQGAFVSDQEVSDVVEFIKEHNENRPVDDKISQQIEQMQASANTTVSISDADAGDDGRDAYFEEAAQIIVDKEKASIGMLQRYLKVGFNRAARIMDQLEEAGVVGPEEGTKPRKVLMSAEELQALKEEMN